MFDSGVPGTIKSTSERNGLKQIIAIIVPQMLNPT